MPATGGEAQPHVAALAVLHHALPGGEHGTVGELGIAVALLRGLAVPARGPGAIARHATAGGEGLGQQVLRPRVALYGRLGEEPRRPLVVLRHAVAGGVGGPDQVLRFRMPALGGHVHPPRGGLRVLRRAAAAGIRQRELVGRRRVPGLGRLPKGGEGGFRLARLEMRKAALVCLSARPRPRARRGLSPLHAEAVVDGTRDVLHAPLDLGTRREQQRGQRRRREDRETSRLRSHGHRCFLHHGSRSKCQFRKRFGAAGLCRRYA